MDALTIIASIASIIGAGIAIWQAYNAKKSAKIATDAKEEVLGKRKVLDFNSLLNKAKDIEAILIARVSKSSALQRGRNTEKERSDIEFFISLLNEKKSISMTIELKSFFEQKYRLLIKYNSNEEPQISDMLLCVRDIISKISEEINKNTYE